MAEHETWIVVADAARARIFRQEGEARELVPAWEYEPVGSRLQSREIASDRPGRTFNSGDPGRHAKAPPTDPARYESERFARDVAGKLDEDRKKGRFDRLVIVAAPQFLGDLRATMPAPLKACVETEIDKDLSRLPPREIRDHLENAARR